MGDLRVTSTKPDISYFILEHNSFPLFIEPLSSCLLFISFFSLPVITHGMRNYVDKTIWLEMRLPECKPWFLQCTALTW